MHGAAVSLYPWLLQGKAPQSFSKLTTRCMQVQEPLDCVIRMFCYNFGALLEQLFLQVWLIIPDVDL